MSDIAIRVENLGKQYRIGTRERYKALRDTLTDAIYAPFRAIRSTFQHSNLQHPNNNVFWALKDVSFEIKQGDVVGIVGRNGAGKSTLLKILSRITEPTEGYAEIHGRVGSLLEVGTGFHPELTGRENIYLNGAILGMRKVEIERKFDEIVTFAEIEKFIDTPVKHYSSGMYLRLAFAVAAHLEPEILLVDEVLAVGDAAFQKKCLGKMSDVAKEGRTVLFVSHNLNAVKSLCKRAVLLSGGRAVLDASADAVVEEYLGGHNDLTCQKVWQDPADRLGDEQFQLVALRVMDGAGQPCASFFSGQSIIIELDFALTFLHTALCVGFDLTTSDGICVFRSFHTDIREEERPELRVGRNILRCTIPPGLMNAGRYAINPRVGLHFMKWILQADAIVQFDVTFDHGESQFLRAGSRPGSIAPVLQWKEVATT